jgi:hypothetical protein
MGAPETFLHLASGESAAGAIQLALARLGRNETVIPMTDSYDVKIERDDFHGDWNYVLRPRENSG